jgi:hypothetical protein
MKKQSIVSWTKVTVYLLFHRFLIFKTNTRSLLAKFSIDNPYAILYICGWMLGMAIGDADEEAPDSSIINVLEIVPLIKL